jgi:mRNA interferase RelE/StbE
MYKVVFKNSAERFFRKLDKFAQQRIVKRLRLLRENPFLGKPLIGNLAGAWSLRVGKYRVIYQIKQEELIIFVLDVGHRKNIY